MHPEYRRPSNHILNRNEHRRCVEVGRISSIERVTQALRAHVSSVGDTNKTIVELETESMVPYLLDVCHQFGKLDRAVLINVTQWGSSTCFVLMTALSCSITETDTGTRE